MLGYNEQGNTLRYDMISNYISVYISVCADIIF